MKFPRTGGCQCGKIRYQTGAPVAAWLCHCLDCQRMTSSAFTFSMAVARGEFRLLQGEPADFRKEHDPETRQLFCSSCGTWLYTESPQAPDATLVRVTTLDEHKDFAPVAQSWAKSALPWALVKGILTADEEPSIELMTESMKLWAAAHPRNS